MFPSRMIHGFYITVQNCSVMGISSRSSQILNGTCFNLCPSKSRLVKGVMEGPYHLLLESLGERLANEVIAQQPLVQGVCVHIKKPQVHLEGIMDSVGQPLLMLHSSEAHVLCIIGSMITASN